MLIRMLSTLFLMGSAIYSLAQGSYDSFPFYWKEADLQHENREYGALLLPVSLGSDTVLFQLDLGKKENVLYNEALQRTTSKPKERENGKLQLKGRIGDEAFHSKFRPIKGVPDSLIASKDGKPIVGLLGISFFEERTLTIDFIHKRFYLKEFPNPESYRSWVLPSKRVMNKLLVKVRSKDPFWLMYDTGSSPFDLITGRSFFDVLTNSDQNIDTCSIKAQHTNKEEGVRMECSAISQDIRLGPIDLEGRRVCTDVADHIGFQGTGLGIKGVLGNAPFIGKAIVQIDLQKPDFKIFKP